MKIKEMKADDIVGWHNANWLVVETVQRLDHKTDLLLSASAVDPPEWHTFESDATLPTFRPEESSLS